MKPPGGDGRTTTTGKGHQVYTHALWREIINPIIIIVNQQ